jgi:hypothetical protein
MCVNQKNKMKKTIILIVGITTIFVACSPKATTKSVVEPISTDPMLYGKSLYVARCSKCHELPKVGDFTANKWTGIVDWMAPKAKLSTQEKQLVLNYVQANAKK